MIGVFQFGVVECIFGSHVVFFLFLGDECLLELAHRSDDSSWRQISRTVYWPPPPGPAQADSTPSVHSSESIINSLIDTSKSGGIDHHWPLPPIVVIDKNLVLTGPGE